MKAVVSTATEASWEPRVPGPPEKTATGPASHKNPQKQKPSSWARRPPPIRPPRGVRKSAAGPAMEMAWPHFARKGNKRGGGFPLLWRQRMEFCPFLSFPSFWWRDEGWGVRARQTAVLAWLQGESYSTLLYSGGPAGQVSKRYEWPAVGGGRHVRRSKRRMDSCAARLHLNGRQP